MRGMTLNIPLWNKWLPLAVSAGKVTQLVADKVLDGITHGFDLGIQEDKMGSAKVTVLTKGTVVKVHEMTDRGAKTPRTWCVSCLQPPLTTHPP